MATSKRRGRKRSVSTARPRSYSQYYQKSEKRGEAQATPTPTPAAAVDTAKRSEKGSETVNWAEEYRFVARDLRELVIVSVVLFAAMLGVGYLL
ncbi:hypothetical protein FKZ61_021205 [Litorilinea aerophila]|uniref:Uncharacterized protein n=1 Tax=Litorilinea aerophila TaxID=1204385 RepID=A0A540V9T6_9CHLR|nr:hypothetical protein [Litorilinea aerophila]MCC9078620.1 hypothetical protein [Litorilinea aerophila]OUC08098.1 hypothetical protein RY27_11035 [Litorilinea aerophila]